MQMSLAALVKKSEEEEASVAAASAAAVAQAVEEGSEPTAVEGRGSKDGDCMDEFDALIAEEAAAHKPLLDVVAGSVVMASQVRQHAAGWPKGFMILFWQDFVQWCFWVGCDRPFCLQHHPYVDTYG